MGDYCKATALREIAVELTKAGKTNEADSVFSAALAIANKLHREKPFAFYSISEALTKAGKFDDAVAVANHIGFDRLKAEALIKISLAGIKTGKAKDTDSAFSAALAVAKQLNDADMKADAFRDIAVELTKAGKFDDALAAANKINDNDEKAKVLSSVYFEIYKFQQGVASSGNR